MRVFRGNPTDICPDSNSLHVQVNRVAGMGVNGSDLRVNRSEVRVDMAWQHA